MPIVPLTSSEWAKLSVVELFSVLAFEFLHSAARKITLIPKGNFDKIKPIIKMSIAEAMPKSF